MQGEERDYKQIKIYGKLGDFAEKLKEEERKMLLLQQQQLQNAFPIKTCQTLKGAQSPEPGGVGSISFKY